MKLSRLFLLGLLALTLSASPVLAGNYLAGLGAGAAPDYEGSEDYDAVPVLMFSGHYDSGRYFKLMGTNFKLNLLANEKFGLGPALNYRQGREDVDNDEVDDLDDVDPAWEAGLFGAFQIDNFSFGLEWLHDISDEHDGSTYQVTAGYNWKINDEWQVVPGIFTTYADEDYMETYFEIDEDNIGKSTIDFYDADAGFKDVGGQVFVHYTPWDHWGIASVLSVSTLVGDAEDSPVVDDEGEEMQYFFGLMATYRWAR